jgi:hypothetical protein
MLRSYITSDGQLPTTAHLLVCPRVANVLLKVRSSLLPSGVHRAILSFCFSRVLKTVPELLKLRYHREGSSWVLADFFVNGLIYFFHTVQSFGGSRCGRPKNSRKSTCERAYKHTVRLCGQPFCKTPLPFENYILQVRDVRHHKIRYLSALDQPSKVEPKMNLFHILIRKLTSSENFFKQVVF